MACAGMAVGFIAFWLGAHPGIWLAGAAAAFLIASAAYVLSRPTTPPNTSRNGSR
jgi:hypothetical protein